MCPATTTISQLAVAQLAAYNSHDLDRFCDCYHDDVRVLAADGETQVTGIADFRARYAPMFARGHFGATVDARLELPNHCVERERWWRDDPNGGPPMTGTVLVRYTERDGKIGVVVFLSS
ncbi:MAG: nuclear transport factor 2 family protein [Myxococcales bacterium]|nr:nuclear transport factor 2 family protein [Myxococcales bacterium]